MKVQVKIQVKVKVKVRAKKQVKIIRTIYKYEVANYICYLKCNVLLERSDRHNKNIYTLKWAMSSANNNMNKPR